METTSCTECGIVFGVPDAWLKARRTDGRNFCCPNGHRLAYKESTTDALRRERDLLKQRLAERDDAVARAEKSLTTARGQITRLKKRAKAGVCPCCNRTFQNMAAHMATCHPDMDPNIVDLETEKTKLRRAARGER